MPEHDFSPWWSRAAGATGFKRRLFCFPFAGGGASVFRLWQKELPPDVEVIGVQLPGREGRFREPLVREMDVLVRLLAEAISPLLDRPTCFFGHSAGALVAFELARQLEANREFVVEQLIVGGCNPPHLQSPLNDSLYHLDDAALVAEMRRLNGTPQIVFDNPELLALFLPVVRADIGLAESYLCPSGSRVNSPIVVLRGERDSHTNPQAMARWGELTTKGFSLRNLPGDHFFPLTNRPATLDVVRSLLSQV